MKNVYLFSCFCGLCISDIIGLKWKNIYIDNGQYRLDVVMQKTKEPIYLPLSQEAWRWMPERGEKTAEGHVFDLPSPTYINVILKPCAKVVLTDMYHGVNRQFLQHCLYEFCYQFNRRYSGEHLFERWMIAAVCTKPSFAHRLYGSIPYCG